MTTILVYLCFFLGVIQLVKLPFKAYSALKNPEKFGGVLIGKRNNRSSGIRDDGTAGNGNNCNNGASYNHSTNGNSDGMPDIDYNDNNDNNISITDCKC